jgi:hypothetical protein
MDLIFPPKKSNFSTAISKKSKTQNQKSFFKNDFFRDGALKIFEPMAAKNGWLCPMLQIFFQIVIYTSA